MVFANNHRREKKQSTHWRVLLFLLLFIMLNCLAVSAQGLTDITVQKVWNDENNNDHYRDQACIQLQYGGQPSCYQTVFPGTSNTEQFTFTEMISEQTWSAAEIGTACVDGPVLPHEYIQLEWIESTGTQYIDTGVTGGSETYFEVEFITYNPITKVSSGAILGARTRSELEDYSLSTYAGVTLDKGRFYNVGTTYDGWNHIGVYDANLSVGVKQTCSYRNGVYTDPLGNTTTATLSETFESQANIYVFAKNYLDKNAANELGLVRLYHLNLWKGNNLVRDFIPCYRLPDGEIGLYDTVNDVFYTNQGTGEFIKGPSVGWPGVVCPDMYDLGTIYHGQYLEVDYLEAPKGTRTNLITDYYPNEKTKVDAVFEVLSSVESGRNDFSQLFWARTDKSIIDPESYGFVDAASADAYFYVFHPGLYNAATNTWRDTISYKTPAAGVKYRAMLSPSDFSWTELESGIVIYSINNISYNGTFIIDDKLSIMDQQTTGYRLYSLAITELTSGKEVLVRKYIPVYDLVSEKYGLYETQTNTFIAGTGNFSGPAIQ
ncbi:MAG: hypothetical protein IJI14_00790 [Anaerolineaceae bacterium]|nr:hypothetical protein [Anaerolineaceae bacterium]